MSQIKQMLLLKKQNVSNRRAAVLTGMDKETVNNYMRKVRAAPLGIDGLLRLDDPMLEQRLKGDNAAYPYSREERFLAVDKPNLLPLPESRFEIRCYTDLKVGANCCIYLGRDKHYYSVPYQYVGRQVHVEYTRTLVKVYAEGKLIATHERDYARGRYTTRDEHFASNSREYRGRTPQRYIDRCAGLLPELGRLVELMFLTPGLPPEMHYRSCDGLLNLQRNTDPEIFRTACQTAIAYGKYNYGFVLRLVESRCAGVVPPTAPAPPPGHGNIRGKSQFT